MSLPPEGLPFGRYRLVERLGAGGMAVVYRAVAEGPRGFQRTVVVKRILPTLAADAGFVEMLAREGKLTALLHHPNIVQVFELGELEGEHYLVLEYVDGCDLRSLARASGKPLPPAVAAYIASEIAGALAYVHALTDAEGRPYGIVHRDVSPSNVMLSTQGAVRLLDLGVARAAHSIGEELTRTGTLKGKMGYLSPEQAEGQPLDGRSDIFALGIVLHEMLTGQRLFRGDDDLRTLDLVRRCQVSPPGVDGELDGIVMRMLERDPAARHASSDEVRAALTPVVRRLHGDATALRDHLQAVGPIPREAPPPPTTRTFDLRSPARPPVAAPAGEPPSRPRSRAPAVLAAAVAFAAVAVSAWVLGRQASPPPPPVSVAPAPPPAPPQVGASIPPEPARPASPRPRPSRRAPSATPDRAGASDLYDPFAHERGKAR